MPSNLATGVQGIGKREAPGGPNHTELELDTTEKTNPSVPLYKGGMRITLKKFTIREKVEQMK